MAVSFLKKAVLTLSEVHIRSELILPNASLESLGEMVLNYNVGRELRPVELVKISDLIIYRYVRMRVKYSTLRRQMKMN